MNNDDVETIDNCPKSLAAWKREVEKLRAQLEAERQRADEITEQYVDRTTALSFASQRVEKAEKSNAFLKAELAQLANFNPDWDMLEACRESWREVVALLKDREAELAKLKGDQVPLQQLFKEAIAWGRVYGPTMAKDLWFEMLETQSGNFAGRFTAPQKPVVLPETYEPRMGGNYEIELVGVPNGEVYLVSDVKAAIEAAGGIVKDGE